MMNKIQDTYLALLRAAIWGGELTSEGVKELTNEIIVSQSGKERVNEVIRLAAFQGTGPLVFDQLLKLKDADISDALRMQMKQQCMSSMMQQQRMLPILIQAWKALQQAGIHPVLLKGFGLAQYYPQPHLRQWGDMDVYVGKDNYHKGCKALLNIFPDTDHPEEEKEDYKHYNFVFDNAILELHRISMEFAHPNDRHLYEHLEATYLTKDGPSFELNGIDITTPEDTFNVFFVFLHAWHHFFETGMNIKQFCDVAVLLHAKREVIDKKRLHEMLVTLHLLEVWQLFMYIMVQYHGLPQEECPFYTDKYAKRAELLFERIMQEGSSRRPIELHAEGFPYLKRKWVTFQSRIANSRLVKPYAPEYARHMVVSDIFHGIERILQGK